MRLRNDAMRLRSDATCLKNDLRSALTSTTVSSIARRLAPPRPTRCHSRTPGLYSSKDNFMVICIGFIEFIAVFFLERTIPTFVHSLKRHGELLSRSR